MSCGSSGPGAWAATQYWDTGTAGGIQGTSTNVGWSTSSNAWSSLSTGTTTPGTWTNGNDAVFNTGSSGAPIATVTVFSVSANSLTFGPTVNGRVVFMPGSGALTNGAGGFFSTFDAAVVTFNNDIVLSATQTWTVGYNTTINGLVSGADALWTKAGDYTLTLTNGANSFSSGLVINNGTVTGSGGGTVLGTGPIQIGTVAPSNAGSFSIVTATLNVNAGAANTTTTISNVTITGGAVLQLNNATANVTNTLNAATLARTGLGTLIVIPANSLGVREKIFFTGGTNLSNGILAPWVVNNSSGGNFVSNGANGLTNATYTTTFGAANIVSNGVLTTLSAAQQAYALKSVANLNLNGNTLTIGDGTTAGLILSASITNGGAAASLAFGSAEALLYMISGNTGTIAVEVSGGGGLTKFGGGTLVLSNAGLWSSDMTIIGGTVILSPTADLTYTRGIAGVGNLQKSGGAMLTLTNDYTLGGGITVNAGTLTLAGGSLTARNFTVSGGNTTLRISNEVVRTTAGITSIVGSGSSNNVLMVMANSVWDFGDGGFTVGSGAATGNVMTIDGGTVSNSGWNVGSAATAIGNRLILQNGASLIWTSAANRTSLGLGVGGGISNSITVMSGSVMSNASTMTFGGSFNTFTVGPTGTVYSGGYFNIGGADNQAFVTGASAVLRTGTDGVELTGTRGLMVVSNGGSVFGGLALAGSRNQALVSGTGAVWNGSVSIGFIAGANSNTVIVESGGRINGNLTMGGANSSNNRLLIRGGGIFVDGNGGFIGRSTTGSSNIIHVTGTGSVFSNTAGQLTFGNGPNTGNGLIVESNATFYSASAVMLGGDAQSSNDFLRIDSATFKSTGLTIGGFGIGGSYGTGPSSFNWMTVTNAQMSTTSLIIGDRSATNTVDVYADTIWNVQGGAIIVGSGTATGNVLTINSAVLTNGGAIAVGNSASAIGNKLIVTNGGNLFGGNVTVGNATNASSNLYSIGGGAFVTVSNGLITIGGAGGGFNTMTVTNAAVWSSGLIVGNGSSNNTVTVLNGTTWNMLGGGLTVGANAATGNVLRLDGASTLANIGTLWLTNNLNQIRFNSGTLSLANAFVSNQVFTAGDGVQRTTLQFLGGTNIFASGLLITSNTTLKGTGTLRGTTILTNGATIAPGNSPGILNVQDMVWYGGAIYSNDLVNFTGGIGTGWDYINGSGSLVFSNGSPNYVLRLDSGGGLAANFDSTADYALAIAGFSAGITNFNASLFTIDTSAFANPFGGSFGLSLADTTLYLTYSAISLTPDYTWTNAVSGAWSAGSGWQGGTAPLLNGSASQILQFNGSGSASYIATNDRTSTGLTGSYTNNRIAFNSTSTSTNTLSGATLTIAGANAALYQLAGGAFIVSNPVVFATDTAFRGAGVGTVVLASNITGPGALTKAGAWNLVLQGSNSFAAPVWVNAGTLTLANVYALGTNSVTVSNGAVASSVAYTIGQGWNNQAVLITGSGASWTNNAALTVGAGNASGNKLIVQNSGSLYVNGSLVIGTNGALANSLVVSNSGRVFGTTSSSADAYIGFGAGSNTVQIAGGGSAADPSVWIGGGRFVYVGSGAGGISNSLVIDGRGVTGSAVLTNVQINVGANAVGAYNNVLIVTNGGTVARGPSTSVTIIGANGARSNAVLIIGGGLGGGTSVWVNGNQPFRIGSGAGGASLIGSNRLVVDGNGVVGGAVLRNVGTLTVGEQENWDSLVIANGGSVSSAGAVIIGNGIGAHANNNTATISGTTAASVWNLGNSSLTVGSATTGTATNNTVVIGTGGLVTNVSTATIGVGPARTNALVLSGGQFWATSVIATSAGNRVVFNAGTMGAVGMTYSNGTALVVGDGVNAATLQLGNGTHQFNQGINLLTNSYLKGNGATLGATITNTLIGGAIAIGADAGNTFTVNGVIQGAATQLTKQDGGTVVLAGVNTFTAPVAVNAGTLTIANSTGTGLSALAPVTVSGGNFVVNNTGGTGVAGNIAVNSGTLLVNNTGVSAGVGAASTVTVGGGHVSGNGTIAGGVVLNTGTLTAGNSSLDTLTMGSLTVNGGYLPFEFLNTGLANDQLNVTDSGGLTINGGTVLLYTNNSTVRFDAAGLYYLIQYNGSIGGTGETAFTVGNQANTRTYNFGLSGGFVTLAIGGNGAGWNPGSNSTDTYWMNATNWAGGNGPAPVAFDQLLFDGNTKVSNTNNFASNTKFSGMVFTNSAGAFVLNGMAAGTNAVNLVGDVINRSANTQTINLPLVLDGGSRAFNTLNGNMIINGVISGSGVGIIKTGTNLLTLTGANTFAGNTEIQNGVLRATDGVGLPTTSNLKINGGVLESSGSFLRATGTVAGAVQWTGSGGFSAFGGSMTVNLSGGAPLTWGAGSFVPIGSTLVFGSSTANNDVWFENAIDLNSGVRTVRVVRTATLLAALSNGGLSKTGSGTLVLAGNSTFSGDTTVNAGTLVVNGQVAGGGAFVMAGGTTLGGTGEIARTLSGAGRVAPGSSPGVLTAGQVDPTLGMDFSFEFTSLNLASYSSFNDVLRLTNAAPFTANLTGANVVDLYIQTALVDGITNVFRGGFYADQAGNFDGQLTNATFVVHGGGTLAYVQTVASSTFVPGGYVMEFGVIAGETIVSVVPEPNVLVLWLAGGLTFWFSRRKRSHLGV